MLEPIFWLGLSILLVAVSLTAVLIALLPVVWELARAARSAEKLFDTLSRELPPTLEAIRLTGTEITDLTDDMSQSVQSASQIAKQVDQSLTTARKQVQQAGVTTRSTVSGLRAAWSVFFSSTPFTPTAEESHAALDDSVVSPSPRLRESKRGDTNAFSSPPYATNPIRSRSLAHGEGEVTDPRSRRPD